ncbi:MAG: lamin tail domain-containing protein [Solirubrobacteraceae bacterium]
MPRRVLVVLLILLAAPASTSALTQRATVLHKGGVNDGDTIIVKLAGRTQVIRFLGVQASELTAYNNDNPSKWRGECYAVPAARYVLSMVRKAHFRARLSSPTPRSDSRGRLIRRVELLIDGTWRDLGKLELGRGLALWLHNASVTDINQQYSLAEQQAAASGLGLWKPDACGAGPSPGTTFELRILSDPIGDDTPDGEWVRITNTSDRDVPLTGWYLGDAGPKSERFHFPAGTTLGAGQSIAVFNGGGTSTSTLFYRGLTHTLFENSFNGGGAGDGAYLIDPDGDVRGHSIYPCLLACSDPEQGALEVHANPIRGPEYVTIRNVSDHVVDLYRYELRVKGAYAFGPSSLLQPGETMQVFIKGDPSENTRLERHIGYDGAYMADAGGTARVSTFDEIDLACDAWGSGHC